MAIASRGLHEPSGAQTQQNYNDTHTVLSAVLLATAAICLLLVLVFAVRCFVYSRRRARVGSSGSDDYNYSSVTLTIGNNRDRDNELLVQRETTKSESKSDSELEKQRHGSETKLAVSAQRYHYEKQKRHVLSVEQTAKSEPEQPRGSPSPSYHHCAFIRRQSSRHSSHRIRDDVLPASNTGDGVTRLSPLEDVQLQVGKVEEHEDFAVYEYPGLATAVGHIEIDNPLFQTPCIESNRDRADADAGTHVRVDKPTSVQPGFAVPVRLSVMHVRLVLQQDLIVHAEDGNVSGLFNVSETLK